MFFTCNDIVEGSALRLFGLGFTMTAYLALKPLIKIFKVDRNFLTNTFAIFTSFTH